MGSFKIAWEIASREQLLSIAHDKDGDYHEEGDADEDDGDVCQHLAGEGEGEGDGVKSASSTSIGVVGCH